MQDWVHNLQEFLKQKMEEQQLTLPALSARSGISRTTLQQMYNGKRSPRIDKIVKLADFFECSIDEMLGINNQDG